MKVSILYSMLANGSVRLECHMDATAALHAERVLTAIVGEAHVLPLHVTEVSSGGTIEATFKPAGSEEGEKSAAPPLEAPADMALRIAGEQIQRAKALEDGGFRPTAPRITKPTTPGQGPGFRAAEDKSAPPGPPFTPADE